MGRCNSMFKRTQTCCMWKPWNRSIDESRMWKTLAEPPGLASRGPLRSVLAVRSVSPVVCVKHISTQCLIQCTYADEQDWMNSRVSYFLQRLV